MPNYCSGFVSIKCSDEVFEQIKDFFPVGREGNKTIGKLYLNNHCDDNWGYEISALVAHEGEQPLFWQ